VASRADLGAEREIDDDPRRGRFDGATLNAGDDILVDHDALGDGLRDGIYVLRVDEALLVKRLAIHPFGGRVTVQSDNPNYPDWPDRKLDELTCIGRVIWAGRRVS